jgi:hypothetical protein
MLRICFSETRKAKLAYSERMLSLDGSLPDTPRSIRSPSQMSLRTEDGAEFFSDSGRGRAMTSMFISDTADVHDTATPQDLTWGNPCLDGTELALNQKSPVYGQICYDESGVFEEFSMDDEFDVWSTIHEFFDSLYLIFPIISYIEIASRLVTESNWNTVPDLRTLLYSIRLMNSAGAYRLEHRNGGELKRHIAEVESSRQTHDFADPATLDAVFCSMALFTANNVLGKHGRAFLYLKEARTLLDDIEPSGYDEQQRKLRIEQVLYNTESATLAIYGNKEKERRGRKRPNLQATVPDQASVLDDGVELGQVARQLLQCLTNIHLAKDAEEINRVDLGPDAIFSTLTQHRYSRIQSADVMVTRQWQLSRTLLASSQGRHLSLSRSIVESLGVVAMSWICLLKQGELRVVGLGKLAELALNISTLSGGSVCQDALLGLTGALVKEDYEGRFSPPLAHLIISAAYTSVPPAMETQQEQELRYRRDAQYATQNLSISLTHGMTDIELQQFANTLPADFVDLDDGGNLDVSNFLF